MPPNPSFSSALLRRAGVIGTLSILLLPISSLADTAPRSRWFAEDGAFDRRREEQVSVLSAERAALLGRLVAARDARQIEAVVLGRLVDEKSSIVEKADQRFAGEYGIRTDRNYTYDPESLTIFLLSSDARHGGTPEAPVRLAHRVFPTEEESKDFLSLVKEKQDALSVRQVLAAERAAREAALEEVYDRLEKAFGLDPVRAYRFDAPTRTLFAEHVAPREPSPEEVAAVRAKKEAERKAAAEAETRAKAAEQANRAAERKAREEAEAKAEAEREKARAEAKARKAAERKAREEAEAEREKARAEAKAKAEAERKAAEEAKAAAVRAEEEALSAFVAKSVAEKTLLRDQAARAKGEADRKVESAARILSDEDARWRRSRDEGRLTELQRTRLDAQLSAAKAACSEAEAAARRAARALSAAEDALSRAEKDARKSFYEGLRAQGRQPLTEPGGFLSFLGF